MIDRTHPLPLSKQAAAAGISRGSVYYLPRPVPAADLALVRRIDELHLELPFAGSRMLRDLLNDQFAFAFVGEGIARAACRPGPKGNSVNRLAKDMNRMGRGYSFEVIRARMLYDAKARKDGAEVETVEVDDDKPTTNFEFQRMTMASFSQKKRIKRVVE